MRFFPFCWDRFYSFILYTFCMMVIVKIPCNDQVISCRYIINNRLDLVIKFCDFFIWMSGYWKIALYNLILEKFPFRLNTANRSEIGSSSSVIGTHDLLTKNPTPFELEVLLLERNSWCPDSGSGTIFCFFRFGFWWTDLARICGEGGLLAGAPPSKKKKF